MKGKVPCTTHPKYFDRDEPAVLQVIETCRFVKKLVCGSYEPTGSSRRRLTVRPTPLIGKVEAIYDGSLTLAKMKRCFRLYTPASVSLRDLEAELIAGVARFDVSVHVPQEDCSMHQNHNGPQQPSREDSLNACVSIRDYMNLVSQVEADISSLQVQLDDLRTQLEDAQSAAIEVLTQFVSQSVP
jgi:hypothetical protein